MGETCGTHERNEKCMHLLVCGKTLGGKLLSRLEDVIKIDLRKI
jgi:hypothetical protein